MASLIAKASATKLDVATTFLAEQNSSHPERSRKIIEVAPISLSCKNPASVLHFRQPDGGGLPNFRCSKLIFVIDGH
ncbi:methyltransferase domain-containing protein [Sesbania bispinosa]|nr:methyltransferase domain-containing protein [Sesbania bispinosa]